jgi:phospholipid/cholesterol/gamma-HCH transport system permease protein
MTRMAAGAASFDFIDEGAGVLALKGDWTLEHVPALDASLRALAERIGPGATVDVAALGRMDVAGAYLVHRTIRTGDGDHPVVLRGAHDAARRLLEVARAAAQPCEAAPKPPHGVLDLVDRAGRGLHLFATEALETLSFFGATLAAVARVLARPDKIRWVSVVSVMEVAGLNALPIIMTLNFFVGLVVAYLGARTLADFGASVFTVELVGVSVMREFASVITAVLLAGRTDSAFTAEIGAMKMRQEIDAMKVMGLDPMEALVAPRVIAMLVMTPLLTFAAVMAGLYGGLFACWSYLDVSPAMFFGRIREAVPEQHFWVGMSKAPAFALVLAVVGCRHGLAVGGDVGSLGKRVTTAVVHAIFVVIMLDALFAIWFLEMDL